MSPHSGQSGQALVGTLVIMVLVFAMAGSVAVAASSVLDRQSSHRGAISDDLRGSDALTAAVAQVAGKGVAKKPACSPPTLVTATLPGGFRSVTNCLRFDQVATTRIDGAALPMVSAVAMTWNGGCSTVALQGAAGAEWLFFTALSGQGISAWVDAKPDCAAKMPAKAECSFSALAGAGSVALAAIACDFAEVKGPPSLHILNPLASPAAVRLVPQDLSQGNGDGDGGGAGTNSTAGSIYLLAASTGLRPGFAYEEGALFVSPDGTLNALVAESAL